jgi:hypothetical protein
MNVSGKILRPNTPRRVIACTAWNYRLLGIAATAIGVIAVMAFYAISGNVPKNESSSIQASSISAMKAGGSGYPLVAVRVEPEKSLSIVKPPANSNRDRESQVADMILQRAKVDPCGAAELVLTQLTGSRQELILAAVLTLWGKNEPEEASMWAARIHAGTLRDQALITLSAYWPDVDPASAVLFSAELPDGELRSAELSKAVSRWIASDPVAAQDWLLAADLRQDFDPVVSVIATDTTLAYQEPTFALLWATAISDNSLRIQTESAILRGLGPRAWATTLAFIQSSPNFIPEERSQLLQQLLIIMQ